MLGVELDVCFSGLMDDFHLLRLFLVSSTYLRSPNLSSTDAISTLFEVLCVPLSSVGFCRRFSWVGGVRGRRVFVGSPLCNDFLYFLVIFWKSLF